MKVALDIVEIIPARVVNFATTLPTLARTASNRWYKLWHTGDGEWTWREIKHVEEK